MADEMHKKNMSEKKMAVALKEGQRIVLLTGPGGAGKTTMAELLEKRCSFVRIDGDHEDSEFFPEGKHWLPESKDNLRKAHDKIFRMAKELFDTGHSVVIDYIVFGDYAGFFDRFRNEFGEGLEIKILFPSEEVMIKRDQERECWTTGHERIKEVRAEYEGLRDVLGEENYIDSTGETAEETYEKHFAKRHKCGCQGKNI